MNAKKRFPELAQLTNEEIRKLLKRSTLSREKSGIAYKMRDKDKAAADWYKDMAAQHLAFNQAGHANVKRMIDEAKSKRADDKLMPGMMAVYEEMHADIMRDSAEVQAMIAAYK